MGGGAVMGSVYLCLRANGIASIRLLAIRRALRRDRTALISLAIVLNSSEQARYPLRIVTGIVLGMAIIVRGIKQRRFRSKINRIANGQVKLFARYGDVR